MVKASEDTSSISFTALYTGHVWLNNGLSDDAFHTRRGSLYYHTLMPFEYIGKRLVGSDIKTSLLQRHLLIDHLVSRAIEEEGVTQILEIACGLSPRGYRFCQQYGNLTYIEGDLPDMAAQKKRLLEKKGLLTPSHKVVPLNILCSESEHALETVIARNFDQSKPVLVITEGLINYFSLTTLSPFWQRLQKSLSAFPAGIYLTDNYPLLHTHPFRRTMGLLSGLLGTVSRSDVNFHFGSDQETIDCFNDIGFKSTQVHNPKAYYGQLPLPKNRGMPFVRIIESRTR